MKSVRIAAVVALAMTPLALAPTAHAAGQNDATVSVLHAVPGATVDVYANGKELLKDFKPGTLTDPLMLPAGKYDLKITAPGAGARGKAIAEADGVTVPAGANITVVAHLSADDKPELTPYVNDVSKIRAGKARLTVRHDAAAPAVDVRANGMAAFKNLTNPNEMKAVLPAGKISADVVLAGTDKVVIGPASLDLKAGSNTIVYAWGSAKDNNLKLAVQTIGGMGMPPGGVPTGNGGQAATTHDGLATAAAVGCAAALAGGAVLFGRRKKVNR